jgi:hypothetical protein
VLLTGALPQFGNLMLCPLVLMIIKGTNFYYDYQSKLAHYMRSQMRKRFRIRQADDI